MTPAELKHVLNVAEQLLDADHFAFAQKGGNAIKALVAENQRLETVVEALKFYADPETYCAIGFAVMAVPVFARLAYESFRSSK